MTPVRGYREMKDSGVEWVGKIPSHWNIRKIGSITKKLTDFVASGSFASLNENVKYLDDPDYARLIRTVDLSESTDRKPVYISKESYDFLHNSNLYGGELILPNIGSVGSVFQYKPMYEHASLAPNAIMLEMNGDNRFFYYWFNNPKVIESLRLIGSSSVQVKFNKTQLRQYPVAVPPLNEQTAIAAYLDEKCSKIDEIIASAKAGIEEHKQWKASIVNDAITHGLNENEEKKESGIYWIGKMPKKWKLKRLKYLFSIRKDIAGELGHTVLAITQQGIKPKNMSEKGQFALDYSKYQLVNPGDFAMNHMDLLTGWVDISQYNGVTSPDYRVFRAINPEGICADYYKHIFQNCYRSRIFYGLGQGVAGFGRWRLPADMFLNFILPVPPIEEQKQIAAYLETKCSQIDELIKEKENLILDLESYKKSLIYEVVTGKRKVI